MAEFPTGLRKYFDSDPAVGRVLRIGTRPRKRAPVVEVSEWDLTTAADHGTARQKRAVTLIQAEHIPVIKQISGAEFDALDLRRNVLVSGINLAALRWARFSVGEVVLEGTLPCDPCERMEGLLGPGGYAAMFGMGGLCARLVTPGVIRVGDPVRRLGFRDDLPRE
ncbi:MAG: MOSC domain-containing protein [Deltaproteobacteria bacterium]|nr:MOSC domain-containing protein [Deltaproteobacteria bacterium]